MAVPIFVAVTAFPVKSKLLAFCVNTDPSLEAVIANPPAPPTNEERSKIKVSSGLNKLTVLFELLNEPEVINEPVSKVVLIAANEADTLVNPGMVNLLATSILVALSSLSEGLYLNLFTSVSIRADSLPLLATNSNG